MYPLPTSGDCNHDHAMDVNHPPSFLENGTHFSELNTPKTSNHGTTNSYFLPDEYNDTYTALGGTDTSNALSTFAHGSFNLNSHTKTEEVLLTRSLIQQHNMLYAALNNTQVKHPSYKVCHNCIGIEASAGGAHASVGLEAGHIGAYDQMTPIQRFYSALVCTHVLAHAENVHLTQQTPFDHNGNHFNISSTTLDYDFPNNIATAPSITHTYPPLVSLQHFDDQLGTSIQHTHGQHFRHSAERSINILPNSWEVQGQAGTELAGIGSQFIHDEVRRD